MRIKKSIQENVNKAFNDCKAVFVKEIINLCKQIGGEPCQDISFAKPIMLVVADNKSSKEMNFNIKPIIADRICYVELDKRSYFLLYFDDKVVASSHYLGLSDLDVVFAAMRRVVREY